MIQEMYLYIDNTTNVGEFPFHWCSFNVIPSKQSIRLILNKKVLTESSGLTLPPLLAPIIHSQSFFLHPSINASYS
jgi:hypothetical protein